MQLMFQRVKSLVVLNLETNPMKTYSEDGKKIYHASIGKVFFASPNLDFLKGDRWFQIVDANTYEVLRRVDMKAKIGRSWV